MLNRGEVVYHGDLDRIVATAKNVIWELEAPVESVPSLPTKHVLFKRHLGDRVLYHYYADTPLEGSTSVEPNFEDAYIALLLRHEAAGPAPAPRAPVGAAGSALAGI